MFMDRKEIHFPQSKQVHSQRCDQKMLEQENTTFSQFQSPHESITKI